jgi:hypothetical protein
MDYRQVIVKSKDDLPKEDTGFFVCTKYGYNTFAYLSNGKWREMRSDDILNVTYYLLPLPEVSVSDAEIIDLLTDLDGMDDYAMIKSFREFMRKQLTGK